jgi:signal peptidase II
VNDRVAGIARAVAAAGVVVAVDQATKQAIVHWLSRGEHVNVFLGLDLTNTRNNGVAFGALAGGGLAIGLLIGVALALLLGYFVMQAATAWLWLPVGLIAGGAVGNVIDRARIGAVIDFIDPVAWPAFNIADMAIVLGVLGLLYVVEGGRGESRPARG